MRTRLLPPAFVFLLLVFLQWRSGTVPGVAAAAAIAAFAYVTMAVGRLLLAIVNPGAETSPSAAYALGTLTTCVALYIVVTALPVTAWRAFVAVGFVVLAAEYVLMRGKTAPAVDLRALIGFALCVAYTAAWCGEWAAAYLTLTNHDILPVWGDYFVHGARISQFGDIRAAAKGSIFLTGFPSSFYHFASYMPAAALVEALDRPGLPLALSVWVPAGFLAMAAGAYTLGERLGGAPAAIAALCAVALLPDASSYGLKNGFLSFYWSLMAHPGATYALAAAFVSLVLLDRWASDQKHSALVGSALLAASILFLRAHVFLLFLPAWMGSAWYCHMMRDRSHRRPLLIVLVLGVGAYGTSALLSQLTHTNPAAFWRFGGPALGRFLTITHSGMGPTAYGDLYAEIVMGDQWGYSLAVGILLAYLAALGAFVVLLPSAAIIARRFTSPRAIDVFPAYAAYCWLLLMLFAPLTWAVKGPELIDRPVVLLYASVAIWTVALLLRALRADTQWRSDLGWSLMLIVALLALPGVASNGLRMAHPKFTSGQPYMALQVEPGLVWAGKFLRDHSRPGEVFAVAGLRDQLAVVDLATEIAALSGVPAYLSRPHLDMIKDAPRRKIAATRLAALQEVDRQTDYTRAMQLLRGLPVQWYFITGKPPDWDPAGKRAAYSYLGIYLYRVRKESPNDAGAAKAPTPMISP